MKWGEGVVLWLAITTVVCIESAFRAADQARLGQITTADEAKLGAFVQDFGIIRSELFLAGMMLYGIELVLIGLVFVLLTVEAVRILRRRLAKHPWGPLR